MDTILASPELQAALGNLILAVVTLAVTALTKVAYSAIKTHTTTSQFTLLEGLAAQAVSAAEQGALAGFVKDRKTTAINIVNEGLSNAGLTGITAAQIDAAIESAVKDNLNYEKQYTVNTAPAPEVTPSA